MYVIFIGYNTAMVCILGSIGPKALNSPRANASEGVPIRARGYHSRVVTFLLPIFGGFQYSQTKIAQTDKGDNKYFS